MATLVGGVTALKSDGSNSIEAEELARFAVADHNKKQNALLEFSKVTDAKQQVVAGTVYFLTIEVVEGGKKAMYEAKVWVKPWMDFKEVQEFKPIPPSQ